MPIKVALTKAEDYSEPQLAGAVGAILDHAAPEDLHGKQVLVKPNLLMAHELSCTNPRLTAAVCQWLLDKGARVMVGDSPAFGTAQSVSQAIGLTDVLHPLGLAPGNFSSSARLVLPAAGQPAITIARAALECDWIFSVAKVKAHSQMRITLSVKNCYGCILGMRKAIAHARFGQSVDRFADCVAALWASLPPVCGIADGIVAMSVTGPRNGKPFQLGLVGASSHAPALDAAIMRILGIKPEDAPLARALARRQVETAAEFSLSRPEDFQISGFETPQKLKEISFNPLVLARSIARRLWAARN